MPQPELSVSGAPVWWREAGDCQIVQLEKDNLVIAWPNQEELRIFKNGGGFRVEWSLIPEAGSYVRGRLHMSRDQLIRAFTDGHNGDHNSWWLVRYGADAGAEGVFIRWKDFLNIPGPGTGGPRDPNISIRINELVSNTVLRLLSK